MAVGGRMGVVNRCLEFGIPTAGRPTERYSRGVGVIGLIKEALHPVITPADGRVDRLRGTSPQA